MTRAQRVTVGFNLDEESNGEKAAPRRVRTRQQIMNGEGKRPPATVELRLLAHNPFNPRDELTELEETAESLRSRGQVQPVTVVRRAAFLSAHPGQEDALGEAEYIVVDGNRRLAAARMAELEQLRIDVNDDLAGSAADLLETALVANIHRVDVPPINQARTIKELLDQHGSQEKVAKRLGKSGAWVSQRLALLELPDDLQEKVETGELKVKDGRRIGRLPAAQQREEADKALNRVKAPRKPRSEAVPKQAGSPGTENSDSSGDGFVRPQGNSDINPVKSLGEERESDQEVDSLAVVERIVAEANRFADALTTLSPVLETASATDPLRASELVAQLRSHVERAVENLP